MLHAERLANMRNALKQWQQRTGDPAEPETEEIYRLEVGIAHPEGGKNTENSEYQSNVELMLRWMRERPFVQ